MFSGFPLEISSWTTNHQSKRKTYVNDQHSNKENKVLQKENFKDKQKNVTSYIVKHIDRIGDWLESNIARLNVTNEDKSSSSENINISEHHKLSTPKNTGIDYINNIVLTTINKAGLTISNATAKIKKTVEDNNVWEKFNKEQESFSKDLTKGTNNGFSIWKDFLNDDIIRAECFSLSKDKRTFLRNPPECAEFNFDYDNSYCIAIEIMKKDPILVKMRYELVPQRISEIRFWRNYFYHISLVCQANAISVPPYNSPINHESKSTESLNSIDSELDWEKDFKFHCHTTEDNWEQEIDDILAEDEIDNNSH